MRRARTFLPRRSFSQTHLKSPGAEQEPPRRILRAPTDARESDPIGAVVGEPARPTECGPYAANVGEAEPRGGLSACLSVCLSRTAISTAIDASLAAVWLPQLPLILTTVSYRAGFAATRPAILGECHHGEIGRWARTAVLQSRCIQLAVAPLKLLCCAPGIILCPQVTRTRCFCADRSCRPSPWTMRKRP